MSSPSHHSIVMVISGIQRYSESNLGHMGPNNGIPALKDRGTLQFHFHSQHTRNFHPRHLWNEALTKLECYDMKYISEALWPLQGTGMSPCLASLIKKDFQPRESLASNVRTDP